MVQCEYLNIYFICAKYKLKTKPKTLDAFISLIVEFFVCLLGDKYLI